jgi:stage II sporulation protein AA (anti-sigma F factor antagonist)
MLTIQNRQEGNTIIVTLSGRITFDAVRPLNTLLKEIYSNRMPKFLVINLEEVLRLDSSGIGVLVASRNVMNRNQGQLYLCGLCPSVQSVLEKMNLLNYFSVFATEEHALQEATRLSYFETSKDRVRSEEGLVKG